MRLVMLAIEIYRALPQQGLHNFQVLTQVTERRPKIDPKHLLYDRPVAWAKSKTEPSRRQVRDHDHPLVDQIVGRVVLTDAGDDLAGLLFAEVDGELEQLVAALHRLGAPDQADPQLHREELIEGDAALGEGLGGVARFTAAAKLPRTERQERQQELLALQNDIEQAEVQGLQYLSYAEARLLQPVLNQIDEAIQAEAEAGSYDLVLPTVANNAPVFLYRSDRIEDLTVAIMTRLGIDPNTPPLGQQQQQGAPVAPGAGQ